MRALADGLLGHADEQRIPQHAGRNIDFHFDGQGVDAQQRKRVQLREHGRQCSRLSVASELLPPAVQCGETGRHPEQNGVTRFGCRGFGRAAASPEN